MQESHTSIELYYCSYIFFSKSDVLVEFNFNNFKTVGTYIIPNQTSPKWDLKESFEWETDTVRIQTSFLKIVFLIFFLLSERNFKFGDRQSKTKREHPSRRSS